MLAWNEGGEKMILVIRIAGLVKLSKSTQETLFRMRLRRKYSAVLLKPTNENQKLLQKVRNQVAYGDINKETLSELIEKRGISKKKDVRIIASQVILDIEKKNFNDLDIKPFFRLHPPRGGIDSKKHFGVTKKAVLGDLAGAVGAALLN